MAQKTATELSGGRPRCSGVVIIHEDGSTTCTELECSATNILESVVNDHVTFVPCLAALKSCPRCGIGVATER